MGMLNDASQIELKVYDLLKTVIDPEIGINIIDLGLIYKIESPSQNEIHIDMTLSSKGCPMGDTIMEDIRNTIKTKLPDTNIELNLVWEPVWSTNFVTAKGREALGI